MNRTRSAAEIPADGGAVTTRYQQLFDYVNPYGSPAYERADGHAWDRLHAIAAEFDRGELTWAEAVALADDTTEIVIAEAAAQRKAEAAFIAAIEEGK